MNDVMWLEPAPLWNGAPVNTLQQPWLLEIKNDDFLPEFLRAMKVAPDPKAPTALGTATDYLKDHRPVYTGALKLFQPLHGSFYLITGSLVCRRMGLPDRTVNRKNGERTSFVIRRCLKFTDEKSGAKVQMEQAWIEGKGWQTIAPCVATGTNGTTYFSGSDPLKVSIAGEEKFPMHSVGAVRGTEGEGLFEPDERQIFYGYVATGNREKYQQKLNDAEIKKYYADTVLNTTDFDDAFATKVGVAWKAIIAASTGVFPPDPRPKSLEVLENLCIALLHKLPDVWLALRDDDLEGLSPQLNAATTAIKNFVVMRQSNLSTTTLGKLIRPSGLLDAEVSALATYIEKREANLKPDPLLPGDYNLDFASLPELNAAGNLVRTPRAPKDVDDLIETIRATWKAPNGDVIPPETEAILKNLVKKTDLGGKPERDFEHFAIRLVYDYDPECPPVVSDPSVTFNFAEFFDPDAPPRMVRLVMPSIEKKDLKKFTKGIGMQFSPRLDKLINGINPTDLLSGTGSPPGDPPQPGITMICTFSIQIITIVALVVMFIFLFLLNIIFQWVAFLRICIPVPKRA